MMQKTYLSRALSRAMAIDYPIGDPTGGPAYGEKNEPISAIVSMAAMGGTYTAMMAGNVMAGVAFAGAAISLVGNITGNKALSQIGMVAGLVGGAGMFGLFGEGAKTATWGSLGASTGGAAGAGSSAAASNLSQTAVPGAPAAAPVVDGVQTGAAAAQAAPVPDPGLTVGTQRAAQSWANTQTGLLNSPLMQNGSGFQPSYPLGTATAPMEMANSATASLAMTDTAGSGFTPGAMSSVYPEPSSIVDPNLRAMQAGQGGADFGSSGGGTQVAPPSSDPNGFNLFDKLKGWGSDAMELVKKNPGAANILAKTAGGVADWLTGKTDAELEALKAQAGLYGARGEQIRFEIEREKQRRATLNAGYQQVNQGIPVNTGGTAAPPWVNAPGLINGARN